MVALSKILPPGRLVFFDPLKVGDHRGVPREKVLYFERTMPHLGVVGMPAAYLHHLAGFAYSSKLVIDPLAEQKNEIDRNFMNKARKLFSPTGASFIQSPLLPGRTIQVMDTYLAFGGAETKKIRQIGTSTIRNLVNAIANITLNHVNADTLDIFFGDVQLFRVMTKEAAEIQIRLIESGKISPEIYPRRIGTGGETELSREVMRQRLMGRSIHKFAYPGEAENLDPSLLEAEMRTYDLKKNELLAISTPRPKKKGGKGKGFSGREVLTALLKNHQSATELPEAKNIKREQGRQIQEVKEIEDQIITLLFDDLLGEVEQNIESITTLEVKLASLEEQLKTVARPIVMPYVNYQRIMNTIETILEIVKKRRRELPEIELENKLSAIEKRLRSILLPIENPILHFYNLNEFWEYVLTLDEGRLIDEVLVPLFRAMGFDEVMNLHKQRPRLEKADIRTTIYPEDIRNAFKQTKVKKAIWKYLSKELGISSRRKKKAEIGCIVKRARIVEMRRLKDKESKNIYEIYGEIKKIFEDAIKGLKDLDQPLKEIVALLQQKGYSTEGVMEIVEKMPKDLWKAVFQTIRGSIFFDKLMFITPYDVKEDDAQLLEKLIKKYIDKETSKEEGSTIITAIKSFFDLACKGLGLEKRMEDALQLSVTLVDGWRLKNWIGRFILDGKEGPIDFQPGFGFVTLQSLGTLPASDKVCEVIKKCENYIADIKEAFEKLAPLIMPSVVPVDFKKDFSETSESLGIVLCGLAKLKDYLVDEKLEKNKAAKEQLQLLIAEIERKLLFIKSILPEDILKFHKNLNP